MAPTTREMHFLLAAPEQRLLRALAKRVPPFLRPNHFTVIGTIGAVGVGAAYALTIHSAAWLWVASAMLALNWLGDSLDGTLARVRHIERPRYGYYLDHSVDAFSTAVIGIGLGLSPYLDFGAALGLVVVYLVLSINVYLESNVFGVFKLSYGRVGPTESRLVFIVMNSALALAARYAGLLPARVEPIANRVLVVLLAAMVGMLVMRFIQNLRSLAKLEPQELRRRPGSVAAARELPVTLDIASRPTDAERATPIRELGERRAV